MTKNKIKITVKLKNNGQVTQVVTRHSKTRILAYAQVNSFENAYLRVGYGNKQYNYVTVDGNDDLVKYLDIFTEPELIKYLNSGGRDV